jgi:hypothetical protein
LVLSFCVEGSKVGGDWDGSAIDGAAEFENLLAKLVGEGEECCWAGAGGGIVGGS